MSTPTASTATRTVLRPKTSESITWPSSGLNRAARLVCKCCTDHSSVPAVGRESRRQILNNQAASLVRRAASRLKRLPLPPAPPNLGGPAFLLDHSRPAANQAGARKTQFRSRGEAGTEKPPAGDHGHFGEAKHSLLDHACDFQAVEFVPLELGDNPANGTVQGSLAVEPDRAGSDGAFGIEEGPARLLDLASESVAIHPVDQPPDTRVGLRLAPQAFGQKRVIFNQDRSGADFVFHGVSLFRKLDRDNGSSWSLRRVVAPLNFGGLLRRRFVGSFAPASRLAHGAGWKGEHHRVVMALGWSRPVSPGGWSSRTRVI